MSEKENPAFIERFTIRMPDGMRDAIAERAKSNGRSMNSEIVSILQEKITSDRFDHISSKEFLEKVPLPLKAKMVEYRTKIAKIKLAQAYKTFDENLEILNFSDDEMKRLQEEAQKIADSDDQNTP
jgi:predicted HicB family RNase H-like nuclease